MVNKVGLMVIFLMAVLISLSNCIYAQEVLILPSVNHDIDLNREIDVDSLSPTQLLQLASDLAYYFEKEGSSSFGMVGLVEFAYEFFNYQLCVTGNYWNITKWELNGQNVQAHNILNGAKPTVQYTKFPNH